MEHNVILNKIETIERCIKRINEVYAENFENLMDYTKQDSIILNIERACQASIDIAMIIVSEKKLGIPQNSRDAFEVLYENKIIDEKMLKKLKAMVGFRNIAVHNYKAINIEVVKEIIERHLEDFTSFTEKVIRLDM
jgi:uncharacterized protein YutE (UPF0331/DUF86 family)